MKTVILVGSISEKSVNRKLAEFMKDRYSDRMNIEILDIKDVPMYNEDIENDLPISVKKLKYSIMEARSIIFITPEYNHSIPGVLKNTLDWLSRGDLVLPGKPSMVLGSSLGGLGTVKAQEHLRQIINSGNIATINLPGNEVFIGAIHEKVDENGYLNHEGTIKYLDQTIDNFINWIDLVK